MQNQHTQGPWLVFIEGEFNAQCDTLEEAQVREEEAGLRTDNSVLVQIVPVSQAIAAPALLEALEASHASFKMMINICTDKDALPHFVEMEKHTAAAIKQAKGL